MDTEVPAKIIGNRIHPQASKGPGLRLMITQHGFAVFGLPSRLRATLSVPLKDSAVSIHSQQPQIHGACRPPTASERPVSANVPAVKGVDEFVDFHACMCLLGMPDELVVWARCQLLIFMQFHCAQLVSNGLAYHRFCAAFRAV